MRVYRLDDVTSALDAQMPPLSPVTSVDGLAIGNWPVRCEFFIGEHCALVVLDDCHTFTCFSDSQFREIEVRLAWQAPHWW